MNVLDQYGARFRTIGLPQLPAFILCRGGEEEGSRHVRQPVGGGVATIAIAAAWTWLFPALLRVDRLERLRPEAQAARSP